MNIEHITNSAILKFGAELSNQLKDCSSFSIATAFINDEAINLLENCLKKNKSMNQGRLLIGIYQCFNRKKDLQRLKKLAQQYSNIFQVHISKDRNFHWKYYHFSNRQKNILFVGSANFTSGGLHGNGEIIVKISDNKNSSNSSTNKLIAAFDKELINSGSISKFKVEYYQESKERERKENLNKLHDELKKFFDKKIINRESKLKIDKAVVQYLTHDLKQSTQTRVLKNNPEWETKNIDYFLCDDKRDFEQSCKIKTLLILHRKNKNLIKACWANVVDECDSIKTSEGKYFIAYKSSKEITLTNSKIEFLNTVLRINLKARSPISYKVIGKNQVEKMKSIIK